MRNSRINHRGYLMESDEETLRLENTENRRQDS